jgi:hypothetical protein
MISRARGYYGREDEDVPTPQDEMKSKLFKLRTVLADAQEMDVNDPAAVSRLYDNMAKAGWSEFVPEVQEHGSIMSPGGGSIAGPTPQSTGIDPESALRVKTKLMNRFLMEKQAGGPKTISGVSEGKPVEQQYQAGIGVIPGSEQPQFQEQVARKHGDVITQPGAMGTMPEELGTITTQEGKDKAAADLAKKTNKTSKDFTPAQARATLEMIDKTNELATMMRDPESGEYDQDFPQHALTDQAEMLRDIIKADVKSGVVERGLDKPKGDDAFLKRVQKEHPKAFRANNQEAKTLGLKEGDVYVEQGGEYYLVEEE